MTSDLNSWTSQQSWNNGKKGPPLIASLNQQSFELVWEESAERGWNSSELGTLRQYLKDVWGDDSNGILWRRQPRGRAASFFLEAAIWAAQDRQKAIGAKRIRVILLDGYDDLTDGLKVIGPSATSVPTYTSQPITAEHLRALQ